MIKTKERPCKSFLSCSKEVPNPYSWIPISYRNIKMYQLYFTILGMYFAIPYQNPLLIWQHFLDYSSWLQLVSAEEWLAKKKKRVEENNVIQTIFSVPVIDSI